MYSVYHKECLFAICYLCFLYEILTENIPPVVLKRTITRSLSKNTKDRLKEGSIIALMHIYREIQRPQIRPLTRPPEFFLKAERNPPNKAEKYKENFASAGIKFSLKSVYVINKAEIIRKIKHRITLMTEETKLLL